MILATMITSSIYTPIAIISYTLGVAGVASVAVAIVRSKTITNTVTILKENNLALVERIEILESAIKNYTIKHEENLRKITELENQINNLKTIPLDKISKHMETTNKSLTSIAALLKIEKEQK